MFDRSAAVKLQLRDAKGRFIKMGSHVKWTSLSSGNDVSGIVRGEDGNNVIIEFQHGGKPYTIHVPHTKLNVINEKASLDSAYVQKMGGHVDTPNVNDPGVTPGHAPSAPAAPSSPGTQGGLIKNFATFNTNETTYKVGSADGEKIMTPVSDLKLGDQVFPVAKASTFQKSPYNAKGNGSNTLIQKFGPGVGTVTKIDPKGNWVVITDDSKPPKTYAISSGHFVFKRDANTERAVLNAQKMEASTIYAGKTPPSLPWIDGLKTPNAPETPAPNVPAEPNMPISDHVGVSDMPVGSRIPLGGEQGFATKTGDNKWVNEKTGTQFDDKSAEYILKTPTPEKTAADPNQHVGPAHADQVAKDKASTVENPLGDNFSELPPMTSYQKGDVALLKDGTLAPWIGKGQITLEDGSKVMGNKFAVDGVGKGVAGKDIAKSYRPKSFVIHSPSESPFGPDAHGYSFDLSKPNNENFKAGDLVVYGKENNQGKIFSVNPTNILVEKMNSDKTVHGTATIVAGQVHGKYIKDKSSSAVSAPDSKLDSISPAEDLTPAEEQKIADSTAQKLADFAESVDFTVYPAGTSFWAKDGNPLVSAALEKMGVAKNKPTLVSDEEFAKLRDEGHHVIYRGISGAVQGTTAEQAQQDIISSDSPKIGNGLYGGGTYFTNNPDAAAHYGHSNGAVSTYALTPDAKMVTMDDIEKIRDDIKAELGDKMTPKVSAALDDVGFVAVMSGFDGIFVPGGNGNDNGATNFYTMLNRGTMAHTENNIVPTDKFTFKNTDMPWGNKKETAFGKAVPTGNPALKNPEAAPAEPNAPKPQGKAPAFKQTPAAPAEAPAEPSAPATPDAPAEPAIAPEPAAEAPKADEATPTFPDKGKTGTDSAGNTVKVNDQIVHPKKGKGTVAIVLPSTDSVKAYYPDGTYAVHKQHTITKVDAEKSAAPSSLPSNMAVGDSGMDPATHTKFMVGKNNSMLHIGDKVTHSNGDTGTITAIYTGEKNKTASVLWSDGTKSTKKASVLESEHKLPDASGNAPEASKAGEAPAESAGSPEGKTLSEFGKDKLSQLPVGTELKHDGSNITIRKMGEDQWHAFYNGQKMENAPELSNDDFKGFPDAKADKYAISLPSAADASAAAPVAKPDAVPYTPAHEKALVDFKANQIAIGQHLRGNGEGSTENAGPIIYAMDDLLKDSTLKEAATVWRGFTYKDSIDPHATKLGDTFAPGVIFRDKSFISTSHDQNVALQSMENEDGHKVLVKFDLPAGYHAHDVNYDGISDEAIKGQSHEQEMLLPRNMDFIITGVDKGTDVNGNPITHLSVTGVLMDPADGQISKGMVEVNPDTGVADKPFQILADSGADGDGYHPSGSWGLFGAAGVMVEANDPNTGEKRYLIVENGALHEKKNQGLWQLPGGALNGSENAYQGAAREMHEELDVHPDTLANFSHAGDVVYSNQQEGAKEWKYTNIAAVHDGPTFDVKIDVIETSDHKWVTADELKQMGADGKLLPAFAANVDKLLDVYGKNNGTDTKTLDIKNFEKVSGPMGSNSGGTYTDKATGEKYYIKFGMSEDHAHNEILASKIYQAMGVNSSHQEPVNMGNGKLGIASKIIESDDSHTFSNLENPEYLKKIQDDFAVDALLANWDVAGMGYDNIITDKNGDPVRVDPGAALRYRAQGSPKSKFDGTADEWDFLRDGSNHESSGLIYNKKLFGSMSNQQLIDSADKLNGLTDDKIDSIVDSVGFDKKDSEFFKQTLKERRDDILKRASLLNDPTKKDDNGQHQEGSGDSGHNDAKAGSEEGQPVQLDSGSGADHGAAQAGEIAPKVGDQLTLKQLDKLPTGSVVQYGESGAPLELTKNGDWELPDGKVLEYDYVRDLYDDGDLTLTHFPSAPQAGKLAVGDKIKGADIRQLPVGSKLSQGSMHYVKKEDGTWSQNGTSVKINNQQLADFYDNGLNLDAIGAPTEESPAAAAGHKVGDQVGSMDTPDLPVGTKIKSKYGSEYTKKAANHWVSKTGMEYSDHDFSDDPDYVVDSLPAMATTTGDNGLAAGDIIDMQKLDKLPIGGVIETSNGLKFTKDTENYWSSNGVSGWATSSLSHANKGESAVKVISVPDTASSAPGSDPMVGKRLGSDGVPKAADLPVGTVIKGESSTYTKMADGAGNGTGMWKNDSGNLVHEGTLDYWAEGGNSNLEITSMGSANGVADSGPKVAKFSDLNSYAPGTVLSPGGSAKLIKQADGGWKSTFSGSVFSTQQVKDSYNEGDLTIDSTPDHKVGDSVSSANLGTLPVGTELENGSGVLLSKTAHDEWTSEFGTPYSDSELQGAQSSYKISTVAEAQAPGQAEEDPIGPEAASSTPSVPGKNGEAISVGDNIIWQTKGTPGVVADINVESGKVQMQFEDGTKKWYQSSKMVKQAVTAPAYQAPVIKKKEADPSSPLYGQPKPEMPKELDAPQAETFLPDGFIEEIEQRYAAKINPSWSKSSPQESFYWSKVTEFQNTGDLSALKTLHEKKYISDAMFIKAEDRIDEFAKKKKALDAEKAKAASDYAIQLKAWNDANGISTTSGFEDHFPEPATAADEWTKENGFVTMPDGSVIADWSKATEGSHSVASILDSMGKDDALAGHGMSAMVDSDWIRDNNVRFTKVVDDNGVARLQARFEVSEFHKKDVVANMGTADSYGFQAGFFGKASNKLFSIFSKKTKGFDNVSGKTYDKKVGNTDIKFQSAQSGGAGNNRSALSAAAYITLPENGTIQDFEAALKSMGITDAHPSPKESVDFSKKKQLVSTFKGFVGEGNTMYEQNPALLDTHVNSVLADLGYNIEDFKLLHTELGFYQYRVPSKLRDKLAAESGVKAYSHGNIDFLNETHHSKYEYAEDGTKVSSLNKWKFDPNSPLRSVARFAGAAKGYLSTGRRIQEGDNSVGMSPDADIRSGGARYLFTTPRKNSGWIHDLGYPSGTVLHPTLAYQYLGNYANHEDNGDGSRYEGNVLHDTLSGYFGSSPEMMVLNGVSVKDTWFSFTNSEQKPFLIDQLHAAGVDAINGIPVEQYFVIPGVDQIPDWIDPHANDGP